MAVLIGMGDTQDESPGSLVAMRRARLLPRAPFVFIGSISPPPLSIKPGH